MRAHHEYDPSPLPYDGTFKRCSWRSCSLDGGRSSSSALRATVYLERSKNVMPNSTRFLRSLYSGAVYSVIIESIELLHNKKQYLCRARSKDGHEGISVSNAQQMEVSYPMFVKYIAPFLWGKMHAT